MNDFLPSKVPGPSSPAGRRAALAQAREEGAAGVLEELVPGVLEQMRERQRLGPRVMGLLDNAITQGDASALRELQPMVKLFFDEDKRLLDRVLGGAVQRSKSEAEVRIEQRVVHVSLRDVVAQRSRPAPIEGEVVRGDS